MGMMAAARLNKAAGRRKLSIERLIEWTFGDQKAQLEAPNDAGMEYRAKVDTIYVLIKRNLLGTKIDGGVGFIPSAVHDDADKVAAIVSGALDRRMANVLADYGRAGRTPDPMLGATPRVEPCERAHHRYGWTAKTALAGPAIWPGGAGRMRVRFSDLTPEERKYISSRIDRTHVVWESRVCPVTITPSHQQIETARRAYAEWWWALHTVREFILAAPEVLVDVELTGEMPPPAPWGDDMSIYREVVRGESPFR